MNTQSLAIGWTIPSASAEKTLNAAAKFWFSITLAGQVIFSYYIIAFYYTAIFTGDTERFNSIMPDGLISGDLWGNIAVTSHVFMAAIITFGGTMQLIPWLREKAGSFHRWNGRLYVSTALLMSLSGTFMVITRGAIGDTFASVSILINGFIIMLCAVLAFKYALERKFAIHRRWALRLFVSVSAAWFFRIGLMFWLVVHGEPVGFDPKTFTGPFLTALQIAVYFLPLAIMEIYLTTQDKGTASTRFSVAIGIFILSGAMALGIFGATMGMWLPRI